MPGTPTSHLEPCPLQNLLASQGHPLGTSHVQLLHLEIPRAQVFLATGRYVFWGASSFPSPCSAQGGTGALNRIPTAPGLFLLPVSIQSANVFT